MLSTMVALALASAQPTGPAAGSPPAAAPLQVRLYHDVTLSPAGDQIASVEMDDQQNSEADPHEAVVVRARSDGAVIARYDPCPTCFYVNPTWSPDGGSLAFVASNRRARTAAVMIAR